MIVWRIRGKLSELFCVRQLYTMMRTYSGAVLKDECLFRFRFSFLCICLGLAFVFFWFSLDYFVLVLFAFTVLGLVSSVLAKRLAGKYVSEMTYFCVEWVVKP